MTKNILILNLLSVSQLLRTQFEKSKARIEDAKKSKNYSKKLLIKELTDLTEVRKYNARDSRENLASPLEKITERTT